MTSPPTLKSGCLIVISLIFCSVLLIGIVSAQTTASVTVTGIVKNNPSCILHGKYKTKVPVALFDTKPKTGYAPLTVTFKDKSVHIPTTWKWSFGDGTFSNKQNPAPHQYKRIGIYRVTLTVTNCAGRDTGERFIIVFPKWWWNK